MVDETFLDFLIRFLHFFQFSGGKAWVSLCQLLQATRIITTGCDAANVPAFPFASATGGAQPAEIQPVPTNRVWRLRPINQIPEDPSYTSSFSYKFFQSFMSTKTFSSGFLYGSFSVQQASECNEQSTSASIAFAQLLYRLRHRPHAGLLHGGGRKIWRHTLGDF